MLNPHCLLCLVTCYVLFVSCFANAFLDLLIFSCSIPWWGKGSKVGSYIWRFFIIGAYFCALFKINSSPLPQIPGEEKPKLSWDTFSLILSLCHSVQVTFIAVMMMVNIKGIIINNIIQRRCQMDSLLRQVLMKRYWNTLTIEKYCRANHFFRISVASISAIL